MFDFVRAFKLAAAVLGSASGAVLAVLAPLVVVFKADLAAGEQAAIAGAAAVAAAVLAYIGNLVKQYRDRVDGPLPL